VRFAWVTKMAGTAVFMAAFFLAYFWLLQHPRCAPTTVPRIFIDRWVGFHPSGLALYASLWVYVNLPPAILCSHRELRAYALAAAALSLAGFACFYLWPTVVPRPGVPPGSAGTLGFLRGVDATGNACPSLHVAFAVFSARWLGRLLRQVGAGPAVRALNWAWCLGIVYSTMAIGQHVALDALAGAALGAAAAQLHMRALGAPPVVRTRAARE